MENEANFNIIDLITRFCPSYDFKDSSLFLHEPTPWKEIICILQEMCTKIAEL